jgi:exosortase
VWLLLGLLGVLTWVYWPSLVQMVQRWSEDPQYTHGYVVPLFAVIVLWFRRDLFPVDRIRTSWLGVLLLLAAALCRLAGSVYSFEWLDAGSLLPALAGVVLLVMGPAVTRWAWPVAAFLMFVLPWPWQFDQLLTYPLRHVATICSTYLLQTLGLPAVARGNIIVINQLEVGVVEACSGLGMLMTFFALSTAVALIVRRPRVDRVIVFLSAVPIGVLMNVLRITVTVYLFEAASADLARLVFHDIAGWVMMPLALIVLWLELLFLGRLRQPIEQARPVPLPSGAPSPVAASGVGVPASAGPSLPAPPEGGTPTLAATNDR